MSDIEVSGTPWRKQGTNIINMMRGDDGDKSSINNKDNNSKYSLEGGYDNSVSGNIYYFGNLEIKKVFGPNGDLKLNYAGENYGTYEYEKDDGSIDTGNFGGAFEIGVGANFRLSKNLRAGGVINYVQDKVGDVEDNGIIFDTVYKLRIFNQPLYLNLDVRDIGELSSENHPPTRIDADLDIFLPKGFSILVGAEKIIIKNIYDPGYSNIGGSWKGKIKDISVEIGFGLNFSEYGAKDWNYAIGAGLEYKNFGISYIANPTPFDTIGSKVGISLKF
jgi:hypothetical protein